MFLKEECFSVFFERNERFTIKNKYKNNFAIQYFLYYIYERFERI